MRRILQSATALTAIAAAAPAFATEGWYARADVGYAFGGSIDNRFDTFLIDSDGDGFVDDEVFIGDDVDILEDDLDNGWYGGIGAGWAFPGTGWRLEGEASYHQGETEGFRVFNAASPTIGTNLNILDSGADANVWALMVNAYYDFNWKSDWWPYLGAGVGASSVNLERTRVVEVVDVTAAPVIVDTFALHADTDDWVLSWQLMAGVAFPVSDQLAIDVGYRYFRADDADFAFTFENNGAFVPASDFETDADFDQHLVTIGVRWQFAAPEPPPPPPPPLPPPACPTQQFTAETGKDLLAAMDAAAAHARTCNFGGVVVTGPESQLPAVRDGLVERGVPANVIRTEPSGAAEGPVTITVS